MPTDPTMPAPAPDPVEAYLADTRATLDGLRVEEIRAAIDELETALKKLRRAMSKLRHP